MCACGRRKGPTEVLTSAQVAELQALRSAEELERANAAESARIRSASAALSNANSGWRVTHSA